MFGGSGGGHGSGEEREGSGKWSGGWRGDTCQPGQGRSPSKIVKARRWSLRLQEDRCLLVLFLPSAGVGKYKGGKMRGPSAALSSIPLPTSTPSPCCTGRAPVPDRKDQVREQPPLITSLGPTPRPLPSGSSAVHVRPSRSSDQHHVGLFLFLRRRRVHQCSAQSPKGE